MKKILLYIFCLASASFPVHYDGCAFGDSWVQTYLVVDSTINKRGLGETWINRGVSGSTSTNCLATVIADLASYTPRVATFHIGTNDIFTSSETFLNDTVNNYIANMGRILDTCSAHACTTLVDLIAPAVTRQGGPISYWNRLLMDLCIDRNVKMANMYLPFSHRFRVGLNTTVGEASIDTLYSSEAVHPNTVAGKAFYNTFAGRYGLPKKESTFGHPNYLQMNYESWLYWLKTGATVLGNADTGSLRIAAGETAASPVLCISSGKYYDSVVLPTYPNCTTWVRTSHSNFITSEIRPIWRKYTGMFFSKSRYLQIKLTGSATGIDTIPDLTISYHKHDTETVFKKAVYTKFVPITVNTAKNRSAGTDFCTQIAYTSTDTALWNNVSVDLSNVSIVDSADNKLPRTLITKVTGQKLVFDVAHNWADSKLRMVWGPSNFDDNDFRSFGSSNPLSYFPMDDDSALASTIVLHDIAQPNACDRFAPANNLNVFFGRTGLTYRSVYLKRGANGYIEKGIINNNWYHFTPTPRVQPFTIMAIVKRDTISKVEALFSQYSDPKGYLLQWLANDSLELLIENTANTDAIKVHFAANITTDNQLITVSYSGSSAASGIRCWYDTVEQAPNVVFDNLTGWTAPNPRVCIGRNKFNGTNNFSGNISAFWALKTAVSDSFVKQRYINFFAQDSVLSFGSIQNNSAIVPTTIQQGRTSMNHMRKRFSTVTNRWGGL